MRTVLRSLFMHLLLLCVLLNLGDAPYVDELIAEATRNAVVALQADSAADATQAGAAHPAKVKRSVYDNLLANVALPTWEPSPLALETSGSGVPEAAPGHSPSGPPSPIDKPPRFVRAA